MYVELHFPVLGEALPTDHGYALYAGLSWVAPALHGRDAPVAVSPVLGQYTGAGLLRLDPRRSRLRLRLPAELIPSCLALAGKPLDVAGHKIRLGVPQVRPLLPAPNLIARLVIIKASSPRSDPADARSRDRLRTRRYLEPGPFLAACRQQLDALGVAGEAGIPLIRHGPRAGEPRRRVLRIKDKQVVGFAVQITGLTAEESIKVQERGIGGRRKMGCGFFVPLKE